MKGNNSSMIPSVVTRLRFVRWWGYKLRQGLLGLLPMRLGEGIEKGLIN